MTNVLPVNEDKIEAEKVRAVCIRFNTSYLLTDLIQLRHATKEASVEELLKTIKLRDSLENQVIKILGDRRIGEAGPC